MGTWLGLGRTLILESKTQKEKTGYLKDLKSQRNTAQDMAVNKTAKRSRVNDHVTESLQVIFHTWPPRTCHHLK